MSEPELSVVLASSENVAAIEGAIAALERGCKGISTELILVRAGHGVPLQVAQAHFSSVTIEHQSPGTLIPVLWGAGLRRATGRIVAFTSDQMQVGPSWGRSLMDAMEPGIAGVGGPIDLGPRSRAATAAAWFLRFSMFTPAVWPSASRARDIPGDNAAYLREAVVRHEDLLREGFWEVEYHRRFERDGLGLQMVPAAVATLVGPVRFRTMFAQRFRHGREFGDSRVRRHGESRAKLVLSAPFVPLILLARIGRRVYSARGNRPRFLRALPGLSILAAAWAAGEAVGALRPIARHGD